MLAHDARLLDHLKRVLAPCDWLKVDVIDTMVNLVERLREGRLDALLVDDALARPALGPLVREVRRQGSLALVVVMTTEGQEPRSGLSISAMRRLPKPVQPTELMMLAQTLQPEAAEVREQRRLFDGLLSLGLFGALRLACAKRRKCRMDLLADGKKLGSVWMRDGRVVEVAYGRRRGLGAAVSLSQDCETLDASFEVHADSDTLAPSMALSPQELEQICQQVPEADEPPQPSRYQIEQRA